MDGSFAEASGSAAAELHMALPRSMIVLVVNKFALRDRSFLGLEKVGVV